MAEANAEAVGSGRTHPRETHQRGLQRMSLGRGHGSAPVVLGTSECGSHLRQPFGTCGGRLENDCCSCVGSSSLIRKYPIAQPL